MRSAHNRRIAGRLPLAVERQAMQQVPQGFLVHRLMLENREHGLGAIEQRMSGLVNVCSFKGVHDTAVGFRGKLPDYAAMRPGTPAFVRPGPGLVGIDAAREQSLEPCVDARLAERALDQGVEAEAREMALVEDERMPEGYRSRVICRVIEEIEQRRGTFPVAPVLTDELIAVRGRAACERRGSA